MLEGQEHKPNKWYPSRAKVLRAFGGWIEVFLRVQVPNNHILSQTLNYKTTIQVPNLNAAHRPPRPGRMLGGRHDARSEAFAFAGYRGAASVG